MFHLLLRFTTQKFSLKPEDLSNTLVHLTNFAVNKNAEFLGDYPPGCQVQSQKLSFVNTRIPLYFARITSGQYMSYGLGYEKEVKTQNRSGVE